MLLSQTFQHPHSQKLWKNNSVPQTNKGGNEAPNSADVMWWITPNHHSDHSFAASAVFDTKLERKAARLTVLHLFQWKRLLVSWWEEKEGRNGTNNDKEVELRIRTRARTHTHCRPSRPSSKYYSPSLKGQVSSLYVRNQSSVRNKAANNHVCRISHYSVGCFLS